MSLLKSVEHEVHCGPHEFTMGELRPTAHTELGVPAFALRYIIDAKYILWLKHRNIGVLATEPNHKAS